MSRGFGFVQMTVLRALAHQPQTLLGHDYRYGSTPSGVSLSDLGKLPELITVHRTSISRAVTRLEEVGLLVSERRWDSRLLPRSPTHWPKFVRLTESGHHIITKRIYDEAVAELEAEIRNYTPSRLQGIDQPGRAATIALTPLVRDVFHAIWLIGDGPHGIRPSGPRERPDLYEWMHLDRRCAFDWGIFQSLQ